MAAEEPIVHEASRTEDGPRSYGEWAGRTGRLNGPAIHLLPYF